MGLTNFRAGAVIPAHPLALTRSRTLDERRQRALTRYYLDAGAGGLAVGVHTTQFAIHNRAVGLLRPVLEIASQEVAAYRQRSRREVSLIAGVVGPTAGAVAEAEMAASLGYDAVLLSPVPGLDEDGLIDRANAVGEVLPVIGFYLQPAVGGRTHSRSYWERLAGLRSVIGIKVAPFNRYLTLDVINGVAASGRASEISLYTGNDDHIALDLIARYEVATTGGPLELRFVGGLLGQWSMWTQRAVELLEDARAAHRMDREAADRVAALDAPLTDANGAIFDAANGFKGCIPGIQEVLTRHGLLEGRWCLDPDEDLSPGQLSEIDRIWRAYPALRDDDFVATNLDHWLSA